MNDVDQQNALAKHKANDRHRARCYLDVVGLDWMAVPEWELELLGRALEDVT